MCSRVVAAREQRRVQPRMQRLHPPVEDLRRAGELGDVGDLDPGLADRRRRAAGGEDLDPELARGRGRSRRPRSCRRPRSAPCAPAPGSRPAVPPPSCVIAASMLIGAESIPRRSRRSAVPGSIETRPAAISRIASGSSSCSIAWIAASSSSRSRSAGTGTGRWRMIGPESTPSSTKWTVTPVTRTPCSSACPIASRPGNEGSSAGWTLIIRSAKRATNAGREQLHVAGEDDEVDLAGLRASRRSRGRAPRGRRSSAARERRGLDPGARARSSACAPGLSEPTATTSIPSRAVELVEDRLQVGAGARGEHRRPGTAPRSRRTCATRSFGKRAAGRAQPPGVDQRVDLARAPRRRASRRTRRSRAARRRST